MDLGIFSPSWKKNLRFSKTEDTFPEDDDNRLNNPYKHNDKYKQEEKQFEHKPTIG